MSTDYSPGLEGVIAFETEIAEPDKDGGALRYRGVDIEDLVGSVTFGNVWALLVDGKFGPGLPPAEPFPIPLKTKSSTNPVRNMANDSAREAAYTTAAPAAIATKFQNVTRAPPHRSAARPPSGRTSEPRSGPRKVRYAALTGVANSAWNCTWST